MQQIPLQDPAILLSWVNTQLRDNYPEGLAALCADYGVEPQEIERRLKAAGFTYAPELNKFW